MKRITFCRVDQRFGLLSAQHMRGAGVFFPRFGRMPEVLNRMLGVSNTMLGKTRYFGSPT